jgi:uncharacterized membrane protein HdeD (DUF308 family)
VIRSLARNWWALALRGLIAVTFGVALLVWQGLTLEVVVRLFALFALVAGAMAVIVAVVDRQRQRWWVLLLEGLGGILLGLVALLWPALGTLGVLYLIVLWGILSGGLQVLAAFSLRRDLAGGRVYGLLGGLTIILGVVVIFAVGTDLLAWLWLIALYIILSGVLLFALAWRLRRWGNLPRKAERVG